jgi:exopolysaccharide biosynthesis predicted pyruvyltransferase EpsI
VVQTLRRFRNERILFVPNHGNAGDTLITLGAAMLLDQLGLDYETGDHRSTCKGRVVVYSGGGNLVEPYPNLRDFIDRNEPTSAAFVILPHTVRAWPETLAAMGAHSIVFAREPTSLAYLEAHLKRKHPPWAAVRQP